MCISKFIRLVILLVMPVVASGQVFASPVLTLPLNQAVSTQNGLPQDIINDVVVDAEGFVWIATEGGLARWDGNRVEVIKGPDDIFVNAAIVGLYLDRSASLWILTYQSGIYRYQLDSGEINQVLAKGYRTDPDWPQYSSNIQLGYANKLYVSLAEDVVAIDPNTNEYETVFSLSDEQLEKGVGVRFVSTLKEQLLVATTSGLFAVNLAAENRSVLPVDYHNGLIPDESSINAKYLLSDSRQLFWVATVKGAFMAAQDEVLNYLRHGQRSPFRRVVDDVNVWKIVQHSPHQYWLGTNKGLFKLSEDNSQTWHVEHILEPSNGLLELSDKRIRAIARDAFGNLWLGTQYAGLQYFNTGRLSIELLSNHLFDASATLSHSSVWAIHQENDRYLWIGTENGLTRYDNETERSDFFITSDNGSFPENESNIAAIYPGPDNLLFLQTYGGIRQFDKISGELLLPALSDSSQGGVFDSWTQGLAQDVKGRLYFIGDDFYRYDPVTKRVSALPLPKDVFNHTFGYAFLGTTHALKDKIFLSMYSGLYLIDVETFEFEQVYEYTEAQQKKRALISSWVVDDARGNLWLGFNGVGLVGMDLETFEVHTELTTSDVLINDNVYGLNIDRTGVLWFSSHKGLHAYAPDENIIHHYLYGQVLSVSEFNERAAIRLKDGRMAFGATQGVVIFEPQKLKSVSSENALLTRQMVITGLHLDSRSLPLPMRRLNGLKIPLRYDDFGIRIDFSSMSMSAKGFAKYRYQLIRDGKAVVEGVTQDTQINFALLQPGDYQFVVSPTPGSFPFSVLPADLSFTMPYAPWKSPFALAGYALLICLLISAYLLQRQQVIRRLKDAQEQVALFYDAFKHTRDWVIIFDKNKRPVAANPAFEKVFGLTKKENLFKQLRRLYSRYPSLMDNLSGRLNTLKPGEFWKDESSVEGKDGRKYDVLIDVTAIGEADIDHYLLVISDISEQKSAERKLMKIANYDSLTGLVNRNLLIDRLEHAIENARSRNNKIAVLFVDLDRFKGINDSLGHDYGDKLLRVIASRMRNLVPVNGTVARLGGDEFVIVLEEIDNAEALGGFVSELISAIKTPVALSNETLQVSCSVGLAFYPDDGEDPAELIKHADVAMYSAKKDLLGNFTYFTRDMNERAKHRLEVENRVKRLVNERGFFNHYQPIINTQTGKTAGVEMLLRAQLDETAIYPDEFIPVLEQLKLIIDVTRQAMQRAIHSLAQWYQQGFDGYVSINLSALHFKTDFDVSEVLAMLEDHQLPVSALRFEITEGVLMDDTDNALRQINRMVEAGFVLALDDFGTGYSSLSYLKRYPLAVLKIDKSFITDLKSEKASDALVVTTINLAHSLNMESIAEGVESASQSDYLQAQGCIFHQGYFYAKPVGAEDIPGLLFRDWHAQAPG